MRQIGVTAIVAAVLLVPAAAVAGPAIASVPSVASVPFVASVPSVAAAPDATPTPTPTATPTVLGNDDPQPIGFSTTSVSVAVGQPISATLELGSWWNADCIGTPATGQTCVSQKTLHLTLDGETVVENRVIDAREMTVTVYDPDATLHVGTHKLDVACDAPFTCASTTPLTVTATAAPLAVDGRIETDEAHPTGAIVTALLTGDVIDQYLGCDCSLDPAGKWSVRIVDDADSTVISRTFTIARGAQKDVSFYWNTVPRGQTYTAEFAFVPSGAHAADLTVTGDSIRYASPVAGMPTDDSTPDPSVQTVPTAIATGATVPAWTVVVAAALALGFAIAIAALVIRLARGPVIRVPRTAQRAQPERDAADDVTDAATADAADLAAVSPPTESPAGSPEERA